MFKKLFLRSKLFLWAIIAIIVLPALSLDFPPSTYSWKMGVKYGLAEHIDGGFARFGELGVTPLCRERDNPKWSETSAQVLANNPAGIIARSAHFGNYDRRACLLGASALLLALEARKLWLGSHRIGGIYD